MAAALALLLAMLPGAADAQDWRYRVRPGDTVWDLARTYVRSDIPWQQLQSHNAVEDPRNLVPGSVLAFPVRWLRRQPAQAVVVAVSGAATASRDGSFDDAFTVTEGLRLGAGTALRTPVDASLTLEFADGSRLQLHGDGELHLDRLSAYGATGMVDTRLRLPRGRTSSNVQRSRGPGSRYIIETPGMMSSVRGTEFRVGTDGSTSRSEVVDGRVQVSGGGGSVLVTAGRGTAQRQDGKLTAPVPLLPAPDLSDWPQDIVSMPATLAWPAIEGGTAYRLQASTHADFRTLLMDRVTDTPQVAFDVRNEGRVHLRLRAIDANGLEGLDALAQVVIAAQPAPPFVISPGEGGTAMGPRPRLRWTEARLPGVRYRVQLDRDGDFTAPLVAVEDLRRPGFRVPRDLPPGDYAWRVGAIDAEGRAGPWGDAVRFTLHPPGEGPSVDTTTDAGALDVRWRKGNDDQRYRFQLSRDAAFGAGTSIDRVLDDNTISLPDLRAGTWHMRVRAVDDDGYEHAWGPVQSVKVGCLPCRVLGAAGGAALLLLVL